MSDMLEQAIIDAEALREAATKNAETLVLEKYSNQIKESIESLLEQEAPLGLEADLGLDPNMGAPTEDMGFESAGTDISSVMEHIPFADTADDQEQIEIPLDKLLEELDNLNKSFLHEESKIANPALMQEELEEDLDLEEDLEEGLELEEDLDEELDEELNLDEDLLESLVVDMHPVKSGWAGTPASVIELAEEEILALEQDSEVREQKSALRKAVQELTNIKESKEKEKQELLSTLEQTRNIALKLQNVVEVLEEKLDKASVTNVKLLYQNKALDSDSLNERQKQKLVEAISNAESVEEAKVIFETLQNTVGSTFNKSQPNSLSEAIQKSSSVILSARKNNPERQKSNPTLNRWKFLAGIDK